LTAIGSEKGRSSKVSVGVDVGRGKRGEEEMEGGRQTD
jgi:hypothetical protein